MQYSDALSYAWSIGGSRIGEGTVLGLRNLTVGQQRITLSVSDSRYTVTKSVDILVEAIPPPPPPKPPAKVSRPFLEQSSLSLSVLLALVIVSAVLLAIRRRPGN